MTDFAAFILSHGRPDNVITYETLRKCGYTGKIYIVIDDEDNTAQLYKNKYSEEVLEFSKIEISKTFDEGDNFQKRNTVVYARNACFDLAEKLGIKNFIQLDDDYSQFIYKFNSQMEYHELPIRSLDKVFEVILKYFRSTNCLTVAMAQNGDFIGGKKGKWAQEIKPHRKAMNTFFCSTDRRFKFFGHINEDTNTYTNHGYRGGLFLTIPNVAIIQKRTQSNKGGLTTAYLDEGTYVKSFYSVLYTPSAVCISTMGDKHKRIHHKVSWNNCVPKIIEE